VDLTIPLTTLLGLADRPGEIPGIGPIDPKPEANTSDCYTIKRRIDQPKTRHGIVLNQLSEVGATAARHPRNDGHP